MKIKTAAVFLMASSIFWILYDLYWTYMRFTEHWEIYKENLVSVILSTSMIIVPISLLLLAISLLTDKIGLNNNEANIASSGGSATGSEASSSPVERAHEVPSVGDWISNFLVSAIPVVGLIFMIIWANNDTITIRRNWAIASLIWAGIMFAIIIFIYLIIFLTFATNGGYNGF